MLGKKSFVDLAGNESLRKKFWPDRVDWQKSVNTSHLMITAYPQDYCPRNQLLHEKLVKYLGKKCPRFGIDPRARKFVYEKLLTDESKKKKHEPKFKKGFYGYPSVSLRKQFDVKEK